MAKPSSENNMSYGLLQDIPTSVEIMFEQLHVPRGLVFRWTELLRCQKLFFIPELSEEIHSRAWNQRMTTASGAIAMTYLKAEGR
jgi:hypothetical protein